MRKLLFFLILQLFSAAVYAADGVKLTLVAACVAKDTGLVYLAAASQPTIPNVPARCKPGDIAVLIPTQGPRGPVGPQGPQGPAAPSALCTWSNKTYSTGAQCLSGGCYSPVPGFNIIIMVCQADGTWLVTNGDGVGNCPTSCGY